MNNTLSKFALALSVAALLVGIGGYFFPQVAATFGIAPEGATCSGIYSIYGAYALGCTGFPGVTRTDVIAAGASAPLGTAPLVITTTASSSLPSNFDCTYDAINVNGGATTTAVSIILPTATSTNLGIPGTAPACLSVDGASDNTMLIIANSSNTVTIASSTGDTVIWNASSSLTSIGASSNVMPSSTLTYYVNINSYRTNSSTVLYTLTPFGLGH